MLMGIQLNTTMRLIHARWLFRICPRLFQVNRNYWLKMYVPELKMQ